MFRRRLLKYLLVGAAATSFVTFLPGSDCDEDSPVEEAGDEMEEAADEAEDAVD